MVGLTKIEDLFFGFQWSAEFWIIWARLAVDEALFPILMVISFPSIEGVPGDSEITAGLRNISDLISIV
jgi:hypothetical protein